MLRQFTRTLATSARSLNASTSAAASSSTSAAPADVEFALPYGVERSASGHLPVYSDYKNGGNNIRTIVRKIQGDATVSTCDLEQGLGVRRRKHPGVERETKGMSAVRVESLVVRALMRLCTTLEARDAPLSVSARWKRLLPQARGLPRVTRSIPRCISSLLSSAPLLRRCLHSRPSATTSHST